MPGGRRATSKGRETEQPREDDAERQQEEPYASDGQDGNAAAALFVSVGLGLLFGGQESASNEARAAHMDSLQTDQFLLAQRKRQRVAECGASMSRDGGPLGLGQTPVRPDTAQKLTTYRAQARLAGLRPRPEPRRLVVWIRWRACLGRRPVARRERRCPGSPDRCELARAPNAAGGRGPFEGLQARRHAGRSDPRLLLVRGNSNPSPVLVVRASA